MKTVKGIYAEAKIFTDDVEDYALAQVKMICDNETAEGSTIRVMPDIHPGKIAPIGLSMTVTDKEIQLHVPECGTPFYDCRCGQNGGW